MKIRKKKVMFFVGSMICKYDNKSEVNEACEWCADGLCSLCGYIVDGEKACNECYAEMASCDHMCTGNCRREGCNCDCGEFHKDTSVATKRTREFSPGQQKMINDFEEKCRKYECEDTHKCMDV